MVIFPLCGLWNCESSFRQLVSFYLHVLVVCGKAKWPFWLKLILGSFAWPGIDQGYFCPPPGWNASLMHATPSIKFTGTHLQFCIHWVERGTGSVLPKNSRQCLLPGLKCRLLHPETSILTVRPWCFPADHTNSSVLQKTKLGTAGLTTLITRDLIEVWILYCCFLTLALAQNSWH